MSMKKIIFATILSTLLASASVNAKEVFSVSSDSLKDGAMLTKDNEFDGFGCDGKNIAPNISWKNAPKDTKSFAFTVYDPDAPTGSGWWHYVVYDIPKETSKIDNAKLPAGAIAARHDGGERAYMGPCPPKGHGKHHYAFTVYALNVDKLDLTKSATAAHVGYMINQHKIASAKITGIYQRN